MRKSNNKVDAITNGVNIMINNQELNINLREFLQEPEYNRMQDLPCKCFWRTDPDRATWRTGIHVADYFDKNASYS